MKTSAMIIFLPMVNLKQNWWKPLTEDIPATPKPAWSIPSSDFPVPMNNWASALASTYATPPENSLLTRLGDIAIPNGRIFHKLLTDQVNESTIKYKSKPLPLGGPPGQVTIQSDFFFNKDLEYLRYSRKSGRPALSISKMKVAYYPDVGLEQMVPSKCRLRGMHVYIALLMVFLTGGSKDNDSTLTNTHLKVIAELFGLICAS
ncbi:hypothetical protein Tco_0228266 [Tanacetum coccineum]